MSLAREPSAAQTQPGHSAIGHSATLAPLVRRSELKGHPAHSGIRSLAIRRSGANSTKSTPWNDSPCVARSPTCLLALVTYALVMG